jgi:hypothetical protein
MSKVAFDISMSLDGFMTVSNRHPTRRYDALIFSSAPGVSKGRPRPSSPGHT